MYPWKRILVPTDFSTAAAWAFDDAVRLAAPAESEVLVLHVRMTRGSHPNELRFPADASLYEAAEKVELDRLKERAARLHATIRTRMIVRQAPHPGEEISRCAAEESVDVIVMSTHARHHVAHLFVGSTTLDVLTNAHVPLLAVRYGIHMRALRRLVVPVHTKQVSRPSVTLAREIAEREQGEVVLVTVCGESDRSESEALLGQLRASLGTISHSAVVLTGSNVDHEILRYLDKHPADALLLNSDDEPSPLKVEVIRKAHVPVIVVPE